MKLQLEQPTTVASKPWLTLAGFFMQHADLDGATAAALDLPPCSRFQRPAGGRREA